MGEQARNNWKEIFSKAVSEARSFFGDAFDSATQGKDIWLRDGQPRSITGKAAQAINRRSCEVWGKNPASFRPAVSEQLREMCIPYLEDIGLPPGEGSVNSPFVGGQCSKLYRVRGEWRTTNFVVCSSGFAGGTDPTWQAFATEFRVQGPISGFTLERVTPACGGFDGHIIYAQTPSGPTDVFQRMGTGLVRRNVEFRIVGLDPASGSDDCGNPPYEYEPGSPYGPPLPAPPRLDPTDPTSPPFEVTVNPDGSITVCSEEDCVTIPLNPDGSLGPGEPGSGEGDIAPGDQGVAGDPVSGNEEPAEGEEPEANLVGVRVVLTQTPPRANKFFNPTEGYYKGAYFVFFGGEAGFAMEPAAQLVRVDQFFYAPPGSNRWRIIPNLGYSLTATPYYKD